MLLWSSNRTVSRTIHNMSVFNISFCRLTPTEIDEQVKERKILPSLKSRPDEFHDRMLKYVYPGLEGSNHGQLIFYYTLLQGCGDQDKITPETHLRLLKKIKPAAPGMFCFWAHICSGPIFTGFLSFFLLIDQKYQEKYFSGTAILFGPAIWSEPCCGWLVGRLWRSRA